MAKARNKKDLLTVLMVLCFLVLATTGILKLRTLFKLLSISHNKLPIKELSAIHDWAGIILVALVIIHLFFQRHWFIFILKKLAKLKKLLIIAIGGILLTLIALVLQNKLPASKSRRLKDVEVKEYQGEDLSSITDFRENSIKGPQYIDIKDYSLEVEGLRKEKKLLTYEEILNYEKYSKVVNLNCVEGWSAKILWEGILLKDLLTDMITKEATTVIFYAYDGYSSSLSLDYVLENDLLLAYKMNGVVLPPERGFPFQVVAEDKWGYKWVKWVTKIELSDNENYQGYWEKAGYNQKGDFNGPKFE